VILKGFTVAYITNTMRHNPMGYREDPTQSQRNEDDRTIPATTVRAISRGDNSVGRDYVANRDPDRQILKQTFFLKKKKQLTGT
jgi:hypothetical protein